MPAYDYEVQIVFEYVPTQAADLLYGNKNIHADRRTRKDYDKGVAYYEKHWLSSASIIEQHPYGFGAHERLGIARYLTDDYPYYSLS